MSEIASKLAETFARSFQAEPRIYRAPGRINLIGEHTDYNDGFVLPAALTQACWVAAARRDDARIVVRSENLGKQIEWSLEAPEPIRSRRWSSYALGVAALLRRAGYPLVGASLLLRSDVPIGAGLSSSAALEVGVATALADLAGVDIPPHTLAQLCQQAEHEFTGARCGIMDQFIATHAAAGTALLLDCRSLEHQHVPFPSGIALVSCNTMVRHSIASGEYNRRRAECEQAVVEIARRVPEVRSLRDVDRDRLEACRGDLSDVLYRRARHVVHETERTLRAAGALGRGDLATVGALMAESHSSLRNDYEVSCRELDLMVEIAGEVPGAHGSRMTGGGFGGSTVTLVDASAVDEFRSRVAREYEARMGVTPETHVSWPTAGAARVL